jgi:hypothetical protein
MIRLLIGAATLLVGNLAFSATSYVWDLAGSGYWGAATNWNPTGVPGPNDSALIDLPGARVLLDTNVSACGITVGASSVLSLNGQTLYLYGPLTLNPSGSLTTESGSIVGVTNAILIGSIAGANGSLAGALTLATNSTLTLAGSVGALALANCTFTNNGTVVWQDYLWCRTPSKIYNYGLWDTQNDQEFGDGLTEFNNFGTFRKSVSVGTNVSTFWVVFNQLGGVLDVQTGTLQFQSGGAFTGGYMATNPAGAVLMSRGVFNINGAVTTTNLVHNGAQLVGAIVINGGLTWRSGAWTSTGPITIASNSLLVLAGQTLYLGPVVTNYGTVVVVSQDFVGAETIIYNYGLWDVPADDSGFYGNLTFNNLGTFRKVAGVSTNVMRMDCLGFNQLGGAIDWQRGILRLRSSGNLSGGYMTTNSGGQMVLATGTFTINGMLTTSNVVQDGANLTGTNLIQGAMTWASGPWTGSVVTIAPASAVYVSGGAGTNDFSNTIITNRGTLAWTSGTLSGGGAAGTAVYNYGLWAAQTDQTFDNAAGGLGSVFYNAGTFRKQVTTGPTALAAGITFINRGIVDVQTGLISLGGGCDLANGTLNFGLSGTNQFGQINIASAAALAGTVSANLRNNFVPGISNSFPVLGYGAEVGMFSNALLPYGSHWATNYGPTSFTLTVIHAGLIVGDRATNLVLQASPGRTVLQFNGTPNADYTVFASTNASLPLASWMPLGQASLDTNGLLRFVDNEALAYRVYTVRTP